MSFCTQTRDTPYSRATSLLLRPSIVTAVITSRAIDMAHLRVKEGANYVPRQVLTISCNQSPRGPLAFDKGKYSQGELAAEPLTAAFDGNRSDEQLIHAVRRLTLRQRHHVPVGVHCDGDSGMAKCFHHHARRYPLSEQERGTRVPQVVEPGRAQSGGLEQ